MTGSLPLVGARAVIVGMSAFNGNAKSVETRLAQLGQASYYLERTSAKAFGGVGAGATSMGMAVASAAAVAAGALLTMGAAAVINGQKYERALAFTGAITGSTTAQIKALDAAQIALSRNSTTTALGLNTVAAELGKAGQSIESIIGGTLQATNALIVAANGELEAAQAAALMQVGMAAFGATAVQVADATTAAVQGSTLSFTDFAVAMRQAGAASANAKLNINDFSAAIGVMGLTIKSGSEVGTSLRVMLSRLNNPTDEAAEKLNQFGLNLYTATGQARPFREVLAELTRTFDDNAVASGRITEAERNKALAIIFGERASKGAIALIRQGTDAYDKMYEATARVNTTQALANQLLLPTGAQLEILRNNVMAAGLAFNKGLDPYINKVVSSMLQFTQSMNFQGLQDFAELIGVTLYNAFANYGNYVTHTVGPIFATLRDLTLANVTGFFKLLGAIGGLLGGLARIVGAIWQFHVALIDGGLQALNLLYQAFTQTGERIKEFTNQAGLMIVNFVKSLIGNLNNAARAFVGTLPKAVQQTVQYITDKLSVIPVVLGIVGTASGKMGEEWAFNWQYIGKFTALIVNWILEKVNGLLDGLASLPIIGEAISGIRATIGDFFTKDIPQFAATASNAISGFAESTMRAFDNLQDFQLPSWHDFAGDVKAAWEASAEARDKALADSQANRNKLPLEDPTESGTYDTGDSAASKLKDAVKRAQELVKDYNDDIIKATEQNAQGVADLYQKAWAEIEKNTKDHAKQIDKITKDAAKSILEMETERDTEAYNDARRKARDEELEAEATARDRSLAEEEIARNRELEIDERVRDRQSEIREQAEEDRLDLAARTRDRLREDEDSSFQKSHDALRNKLQKDQDAAEEHLERRQDADEASLKRELAGQELSLKNRHQQLKDSLDNELDARRNALQLVLEAEQNALDASQEQRENALKETLDAEKSAWQQSRKLAEINAEEAEARAKAEAEYRVEIGRGVKQSIAQARLQEKLNTITGEATGKRTSLSRGAADDAAEREFEKSQEARLDALRTTFEVEELALEATQDARKLELAAQSDAAELELERELQRQVFALEEEHQTRTTALREHHERERDGIRLRHEQERDKQSEALEAAALVRSRARREEDRLFNLQQDEELRAFRERESIAELIATREREDAERVRRQHLDWQSEEFRKQQAQHRSDLERDIAIEDFNRRVLAINTERDLALEVANQTHAEEQRLMREKLAQDIIDLTENMTERIRSIRENYFDRLEDLLADGGAAINPLVDAITDNMARGLYSVRDAAQAAVNKLAEAFDAQERIASMSTARAAAKATVTGGRGGPLAVSPPPTNWTSPVPGAAVTQEFGRTPYSHNYPSGLHSGIDLAGQLGRNVLAATSGTVVKAGWDASGYGNMVVVAHPGGLSTLYGHLNRIDVRTGQRVVSGQDLGDLGSSGNSSGPHVHFEVLANGSQYDPRKYIPRFAKGVMDFAGGLAYVHRNEMLVNLPRGTSVIPAGVGAAESRGPSIGPVSTTNTYQYNVDAHYGRTQNEGSIARDLSALVTLTRR